MAAWFGDRWGRVLVLSLAVLAGLGILVAGFSIFGGTDLLSQSRDNQAERAVQPTGPEKEPPEAVDKATMDGGEKPEQAAKQDKAEKDAEKRLEKQDNKEAEKAAKAEPNPAPVAASSASATASASASAPADTTMYLTVPKMGIYDIPVVEGTTEASLSLGAGHVPGTGYPWAPGSNTYIAGHRLGYPGTASDHVFWNLPNLVAGDQVLLADSNGRTYNYAVTEILEVAPTDLSVTAPTGADVVSLQTCIENYGDYWTPGPNWFARYVVRAERVT